MECLNLVLLVNWALHARRISWLCARYFQRYPGVLDYMERTRQIAREQGFVETILGRRLYTPGIMATNKMIKQAAERAAINAPLQGKCC